MADGPGSPQVGNNIADTLTSRLRAHIILAEPGEYRSSPIERAEVAERASISENDIVGSGIIETTLDPAQRVLRRSARTHRQHVLQVRPVAFGNSPDARAVVREQIGQIDRVRNALNCADRVVARCLRHRFEQLLEEEHTAIARVQFSGFPPYPVQEPMRLADKFVTHERDITDLGRAEISMSEKVRDHGIGVPRMGLPFSIWLL
ncbi:hypothetical protein [Nocardia colli]|uniref:hypothetical protein n=1 Tax=Nocardia colli TaxID=2545717 RepID=UPI0035D580B0